jgi:hypothetical protein
MARKVLVTTYLVGRDKEEAGGLETGSKRLVKDTGAGIEVETRK